MTLNLSLQVEMYAQYRASAEYRRRRPIGASVTTATDAHVDSALRGARFRSINPIYLRTAAEPF